MITQNYIECYKSVKMLRLTIFGEIAYLLFYGPVHMFKIPLTQSATVGSSKST